VEEEKKKKVPANGFVHDKNINNLTASSPVVSD
jgi:hypothetical protein